MRRYASVLIVVCGLGLAVSPIGGIAAGAAGRSAAPPAPADAVPHCGLSPSLDYSGGEQASCLSVGAKLSTVPAVGQTAKLQVTVAAARAEADTRVTIDLPPTLAFADGTKSAAAFTGNGRVARSDAAAMSLAAGQRRTFTRVVKAVGSGFGEIAVHAVNQRPGGSDAGTTSVFATTGTTANTSFLGRTAAAGAGATAPGHYTGAPSEAPATAKVTPLPAIAHPARQVAAQPAAAGTSCVSGVWVFVDQNGVTRVAHNVTAQVFVGSTLVASGFTGGDGAYNVCWSTGGVTQNGVFVHFVESNNVWTLVNSAGTAGYAYNSGTQNIADGATGSFGTLQPAGSDQMRGLHAFQEADDEFQWMYQYVPYQNGCWSPFETTCRQLVIHWQPDSTLGTKWNSSGAYLLAGSPDTLDEPVHEYGHALMYNIYAQVFPTTTNCATHDLMVTSSTTCAWTEGWADWVATSVYNNMVWTYNGGGTRNMNVTWNEGSGYPTGDQVEARVVQSMRSLTDGIKAPWDNDPGEGGGIKDNSRFFTIASVYRPNTFADFWNDRGAFGYDVSQTALGALYQGTIDYGFRNPLASTVGVHYPEAVPDHNDSFAAASGFWSIVAARPDAASDVDVSLFSDFAQTSVLASSAFGGTATDFVGVNSNSGHRAAQTYYPRVHQFAGSGGYTVEAIAGSHVLTTGTASVPMASTQPVALYDSNQTAGVPLYLRAVPGSGQDVQLAVMPSNLDVASRSASVSGVDPGAGNAATLVYTPSATGWNGLVLLNNNLVSGTSTVYADTTAPTGSVVIKGGAATTTKPQVGLTLAASDSETGVMAMQLSTDGVFDTEPVVPFAAAPKIKLAGNDNGTKTVFARYENNAGQWSAPVSDTITLTAAPVIKKVAPASGSTAGGNTVTITGTYLNGVSAVKFGTVPATSFSVKSSTKVTAIAPAHGAANVTIKLTNAGGDSAGGAVAGYQYVAPPTVTGVAPASGSHTGGTSVVITGTGFTGATVVLFGTVAATNFTVNSATKITATSPAEPAKRIDIRVTTPGGTSAKVAADRYRFV